MMIPPDAFYDLKIKGKSVSKIQKTIRHLRQEIDRLKNVLENPTPDRVHIMPSEETQIYYLREYLTLAIIGLVESGGTYKPTKEEQRSNLFDSRLSQITKITLSRSSFFRGTKNYRVRFEDGRAFMSQDCGYASEDLFGDERYKDGVSEFFRSLYGEEVDKEEFLETFENLHIGEWKPYYDNPMIIDGEQWELTVEYGSPKDSFVVGGSNAYPYNFDKLASLLNADNSKE